MSWKRCSTLDEERKADVSSAKSIKVRVLEEWETSLIID
jgi:hypothetical protein